MNSTAKWRISALSAAASTGSWASLSGNCVSRMSNWLSPGLVMERASGKLWVFAPDMLAGLGRLVYGSCYGRGK
jgi:hypothetical protein